MLGNAHVLWKLALSGRVGFSWLATPCRSWTLARRPMLRSWDYIYGLPSVAMWGTELQRRLVMEGNALTLFTVMYVLCIMRVGMYFALENPLHSLMW